jgi:hypothetical protein
MKNRLGREFVLTTKWTSRITGWARDYKMPTDDAIQESYCIEWAQRQKVFPDAIQAQRYFLRSVKNKIITHGKQWWEAKRYEDPKKANLELIDSLFELRTFDEIFYTYLVDHITFLLAEIDKVSAELFTVRMTTQKRFCVIHRDYPQIKYRKFYQHVGHIKQTVRQEVYKAFET